jgi:phosphoglycolate phosphatase-like HAD superfamily hydrolase
MGGHIVWDWNGTLFHDIDAIVTATNVSLRSLELAPLTREEYRRNFCQPVPLFYQRLVGREMTAAEWVELDAAFHEEYHRQMAACGLTEGAGELLRSWRERGGTQSLLSMYRHGWLLPLVRRLGIEEHFERVDGFHGERIGPKAAHLVAHLERVNRPGREVVLIGDSLDDAAAATHVGAACVLFSGGVHHPSALERAGVPVAHTLTEAVSMAAETVSRAVEAVSRAVEGGCSPRSPDV